MKGRIAFLDGLRGIASIIVVLHHFALAFYPAIFSRNILETHTRGNLELFIYSSPIAIFFNGSFGVYLFFILTGIVLSFNFYENKKQISNLTKQTIKRYFRLLPPIIFCNILTYILLISNFNFASAASKITQSIWWLKNFWTFTPHFGDVLYETFFGMFNPNYSESYNPALWVISYFFLGAILVCGLLALFSNTKKRNVIYIAAILILIKTYFYPFVIGILIANFVQSGHFSKLFNRADIVLLTILAFYFGSYPIFSAQNLIPSTIFQILPHITLIDDFGFYHALGATCFILVIFLSARLQKILSHPIFLFLGKISYSLYIFHIIMIGTLCSFVFLNMSPDKTYNRAFLQMFVITLPIIIGSSYLIYKIIETKGEILAQKVYRLFS